MLKISFMLMRKLWAILKLPFSPFKWLPPSRSLKLNTNGCYKGNPGSSGIRGLIRDPTGTRIAGFYGKMEECIMEFSKQTNNNQRELTEKTMSSIPRHNCNI